MSMGIVGGMAQVIRMDLSRAQTLGTMVGSMVPEAAELVRPQIPQALESARTAVTILQREAPKSVHVELGAQRVLKQIDLAIDDVAKGRLPLDSRFEFALMHLGHIPGT